MRVIFFILLTLFVSCSPEKDTSLLTVTSWNAYCFFDGVDSSTEFTDFTASSGYTREKYNKRVEATALFMVANMKDSDIIILEEIESDDVLYDLVEAGLGNVGFSYYGLAQKEDGVLSVGFISKFKPSSFSFHSTLTSRPIVEIGFSFNGENVTLYAVHLRSQIGEESERREELYLLSTLLEGREGENIIVMGDFNTDCISGDEIGDERKGEYILPLTGDGSAAHNGTLFSPYLDYGATLERGSYYYSGTWYTYDNALLTSTFFDGEGLEYLDFSIVAPAEAKTVSGIPVKYDKSTQSGYSDHFAITLRCRYY